MKPRVFSTTSVDQIEPQIQVALNEGLKPTLAIVFSSIAHDLKEVGAVFAKHDIDVFGASTAGEISNDEVHEESIVAMLLDIGREVYRLEMFDGKDKSSGQVGQSIGEWAKTVYENPAFMVASGGILANGDHIIEGIISAMGHQVPLFGGLAGDDGSLQGTFVFSASQVTSNGVLALVFDGNVIGLQGVAFSGWKGIGTSKTVTKADGNIVYEIDGEPALDIYVKYLNFGDDPVVAVGLAVEYPLLLNRDDGSSVLRGVMAINEDKSIVYAGSVPEGAKVRFGMAPGIEIIDQAIEQMSEFNRQSPKPDAIVLFSCKARHLALGPMVQDEVSAISKLWEVPLVGFFTYGEIGPVLQGGCHFHNHTLVPVLIYEK
ncbi:MAG: FIST signal transduction protein [Desulfomonilaceae bacterium]